MPGPDTARRLFDLARTQRVQIIVGDQSFEGYLQDMRMDMDRPEISYPIGDEAAAVRIPQPMRVTLTVCALQEVAMSPEPKVEWDRVRAALEKYSPTFDPAQDVDAEDAVAEVEAEPDERASSALGDQFRYLGILAEG